MIVLLVMKIKTIDLNYKNKKINIDTTVVPWWYEGIGLMFSRRERARILLFKFKQEINLAIHSWFVFYSFVAIWIDSFDRIVDIQVVKPFCSSVLPRGGKFERLVEIPINSKNKELVEKLLKK